MTDCASDSSGGIYVGSASMSLGSLRFFPMALTQEDIKELYLTSSGFPDVDRQGGGGAATGVNDKHSI